MNRRRQLVLRWVCSGLVVMGAAIASPARAEVPVPPIATHALMVDGVKVSYLTAGKGPAVVLLHGYTQTSRMWVPIIPALAQKFLVIAPDLPGIGDSAIPSHGLDAKTAAQRIHALVRALNLQRAHVVGHDIGLMVAYAYAAQFPKEVEKLVLMDAFLPGVGDWETVYNNPQLWHFRFCGPTPEALVAGRERIYFDHFWNDFAADAKRSVPEADRQVYASLYARPGRMRAGWGYFVSLPQAAKDFAQFSQTKLAIPVLTISGKASMAELLGRQAKAVATNVTAVILDDTGHWVLEEQPQQTLAALLQFL